MDGSRSVGCNSPTLAHRCREGAIHPIIPSGFVYLAAILDAWSRKVVGYAISRSMDARIAVAALKAARPREAASITPTEARSMHQNHTARCLQPMA